MSKRSPHTRKLVLEQAITVVLVVIAWQILSHFDAYEQFHEFSRNHEHWQLDEIAMLILVSAFVMGGGLYVRWNQLLSALTERDEAQRQAERHAWYDPLTGLANRRYFQIQLDSIASAGDAQNRVVAIIDLDRFKPVNDLHGHAVGDAVLKDVAKRVQGELDEDSTLARLGGDEFAIIFSRDVKPDDAERIARRIITAIETPFDVQGLSIMIGTSIGLARTAPDALASEGLQHADKALYSAKRSGRGRLAWYDDELGQRSRERAELEADLRLALRREEVFPYFQPIFGLGTGELTGFEVLARWKHVKRGDISPEIFIEIAEDIGLISELGWSILRQACRRAVGWPAGLKLAVNISPKQFLDGALVQKTADILEDVGFNPAFLEFEITESAVIPDMEFAECAIRDLQAMGVTIALDDFGTGFSSLSNLRRLPFDRLKIDRSFITNISDDPSNQRIVEGILSLARGLKIGVTAEGIESESDLEFVSSMACEYGQGFFFNGAISGDEVDWLLDALEDGEAPPALPRSRQKSA
ncbi:putative bifunctional diguanylate cyclase/phosphodiesterase [Chachezhania antarctica]|uniref:putative bifunctional diguanylate cyclase/phosphodiesterase n=1 Tax=Chachezhania antarctica TaxID=2340860 RepID=UPI000EAB6D7B|nr:EAL domain-containing protein [Chachezhania antarctica]